MIKNEEKIFHWSLTAIREEILKIGQGRNESTDSLIATLSTLHDIAIDSGLHLPQPLVGYDPDVGVELEWFYKRRSLTFGHPSDEKALWMHWQNGNDGYDETAPNKARIANALKWVSGVVPTLEPQV